MGFVSDSESEFCLGVDVGFVLDVGFAFDSVSKLDFDSVFNSCSKSVQIAVWLCLVWQPPGLWGGGCSESLLLIARLGQPCQRARGD